MAAARGVFKRARTEVAACLLPLATAFWFSRSDPSPLLSLIAYFRTAFRYSGPS